MEGILKIIFSKKVIVPFFVIVVAIFIYVVIHKIIKRTLINRTRNLRVGERRQKTIAGLIDNVAKYFIAIIALMMILDTYGVDTKSLIASLGILSLVAGLALQDILKDVIAGVGIIFEDQFDIGDVVTIGDFKGTVIGVGIKSTRLKAYTGEVLIIANRNIDRVINHTLQDNISIVDVDVSYASDIDYVRTVLEEVCNNFNNDYNLSTPATICGVEKLGESGISIRLIFGTNYDNKYDYERKFKERIKKTFDQKGVEIPFPQIVVHKVGERDGK